MFCLIPLLFTLLCFGTCQSVTWKSVSNATIPTIIEKDTVDGVIYEKVSRNISGTIFLTFLMNSPTSLKVDFELTVNNQKTSVETVDTGKEPSRGVKIYIKKGIFENNSTSYNLMFSKMENAKTGEYQLCLKIHNICASSFIFSSPIVTKFPKPKLGLEGDPIRISCSFEAYPEPTEIIWSLVKGGNLTAANTTIINSDEHIKILPGKDSNRTNETLSIAKLFKNDSGIYMCTVISVRGKDSALVRINVKDRWAALYPFIGIVVEVIILVAAILAYEKYQIRSQNRKNKNYGDNNIDEDNKERDIALTAGGGDEDNNDMDAGGGPAATGAENNNVVPAVDIEGEKTNLRQREAMTKNV